MSANAMKPTFTNRKGYLNWRSEWKKVYITLSNQIISDKRQIVSMSRSNDPNVANIQRELVYKQVMARKMMMLLQEAKLRRDRVLGMHKSLAEQNASFPIKLEGCRNIDFHFNKGSLEFDFLPMWVLKTKGRSYYINHIDCNIPWSTRERPTDATRGMIRIKSGDIIIDGEGIATVMQKATEPILTVA